MKQIFDRLKSPVVLIELIAIFETFLITVNPDLSVEYKALAGLMTSIITLFAGLNNPSDKDNF